MSETWTLNESLCDKLNSFELDRLRVVGHQPPSPYTIKPKPDPCYLSLKDGSSSSLATHFAASRRIVSTHRFALYVPSEGRRSVGGQKLLVLQCISRVIAGGSRVPKEREIPHAAEDPDYWSHLVAACRDNPV